MKQDENCGHCGAKLKGNRLIWGLLLVAAGYAVVEHWNHLMLALPYLIFLACPLMHFFGGCGRHGHGDQKDESSKTPGQGGGP